MCMSIVDTIERYLGWKDTEPEEPSDFEKLKEALTPEPEGVELTGTFDVPSIDTQCANTAVFPVILEDHDGRVYGFTSLEFDIPSDGRLEGTALGAFLDSHGIESAEELELIVGQDAEVTREGDGNIRVS